MGLPTIANLKNQLAFTGDEGANDDTLLQDLLNAALSYVEAWLGYKINATYGGAGRLGHLRKRLQR